MPKKHPGMTPEEQSEKFRQAVRDAEAAGELDPTEADSAFEKLVHKVEMPKDEQGRISKPARTEPAEKSRL